MSTLERRVRLAIAIFAVVVVLTAGVGLSTSSASFSPFNSGWDGSSGIQEVADNAGTDVNIATETGQYDSSNASVAFILSPDTAYTQSEIRTVRSFVAEGGTLIVAGDFSSPTNDLLRGLGSEARLDGALLRDEQHYYRSPNLTVVTRVENESVTTNVSQLTFNYGTTIRSNNATVLASSSNFSYLDRNRNGAIDDSEELGSRPVVTEETVGEGRIVVVSDPSLFINAMVDQPDNRRFVRNLVTGSDSVLIDASHQETVPPLTAALITIDESPLLTGVVGLLGIGVIGLLGRLNLVQTIRTQVSEPQAGGDASLNSLSRAIAATHPEWEREDVREVIAEVINEDE